MTKQAALRQLTNTCSRSHQRLLTCKERPRQQQKEPNSAEAKPNAFICFREHSQSRRRTHVLLSPAEANLSSTRFS